MDRLGFGVWRNYPETTVDFLKKHEAKGRIFNTYGHGGYIIWHLWPAIPVFIDGRTPTIYDQDFYWLYVMAVRRKEVWEKVAERYRINIILFRDRREIDYSSFLRWLDEDENWRLVAFDDVSNLYMKKGTGFDELIEEYGFRYLKPSDVSMDYAKEKREDGRYLKDLEKELKEACQRFPQDFYPFYYLGVYHQIYGTREHLQEAEKALRIAVMNRPDFPRSYYELGFTLMKLERYDEAIEALRKSIRLSHRLPADAYYYLGASLFKKGEIVEVIKSLETYREKAGFGTKVEAYRLLGMAYIKRYKFRRALSCFERVRYLEEPTWETFANMGIAYFALDELEKARKSFERGMEMRPNELKVVYNLAVVYKKLGFMEKAKRLFEVASRIKPQTPEEESWVQKAREQAK